MTRGPGRNSSGDALVRTARGRIDLPAEQARGQVDQQERAFGPLVEEGVELNKIERRLKAGFIQKLHHQMRLAVSRPAWNCGADTRRDRRIEKVDVQTDMQQAVSGAHPIDDATN